MRGAKMLTHFGISQILNEVKGYKMRGPYVTLFLRVLQKCVDPTSHYSSGSYKNIVALLLIFVEMARIELACKEVFQMILQVQFILCFKCTKLKTNKILVHRVPKVLERKRNNFSFLSRKILHLQLSIGSQEYRRQHYAVTRMLEQDRDCLQKRKQ